MNVAFGETVDETSDEIEEGGKVIDEDGFMEASSIWISPLPAGDIERDDVDKADVGDNDEGGTLDTDATGLVVSYMLD